VPPRRTAPLHLVAAAAATAAVLSAAPAVARAADADDAAGAPSLGGVGAVRICDEPIVVREVRIAGNTRVEDAAIRAVLETGPGKVLSCRVVREDLRRVWRLGFFKDVSIEYEGEPANGIVVLTVAEKPLIRNVEIAGNEEIDDDKLMEVVDVKRGEILDIPKLKRNAEKIKDKYVEDGYFLAEVTFDYKDAGGGQSDVVFTVVESAKVTVRKITFVGNKALTDKELKDRMGTKEGDTLSWLSGSGKFNAEDFERDLIIVTAAYYDVGYINVKVDRPIVTLSRDKKDIHITIHIDEGARYRVGKVGVKGKLLDVTAEELAKALHLKEGDWFSRTNLGLDVQELTRRYRDKGYAYCNVVPDSSIDVTDNTVGIVYEIDPGDPVRIWKIEVSGNTRTRDKVIRDRLLIAEGDLFSETGVELSKREVTRLGFFESVNISTTSGPTPDLILVNVEVKEKATGTFQVGAGFSSVENFIATAQVSQDNLFGRGQTLRLSLAISGRRQQFSLSFIEPRFLDTKLTFSFDAFITERMLPDFATNTKGGALSWGYELTPDVHVFLRYSLFDVKLKACGYRTCEVAADSVRPLFRDGITSSITIGGSFDTVDNRLFPTDGWQNTLSVEVADSYIGSEVVFSKLRGAVRFHYPIVKSPVPGGGVGLHLYGKFAFVWANGTGDVPLSERFYEGGIGSVRGFGPRTLGPLARVGGADPGDPLRLVNIGGTFSVVLNAEVEFPIIESVGIRGVVFFDAGNAWGGLTEVADVDVIGAKFFPPEGLWIRSSVGFGIRWFSPIGPLRFEWGFPLKRDPLRSERRTEFEFTIGNFF
jgi:outer membrane protein insertion porin family